MDDRQLQEAVARCVSAVVFYHTSERTRESSARMASEIRATAKQASAMGLPAGEADGRIARPVEGELMARYGHEVGPRAVAEFIAAFEGPPRATGDDARNWP
jgi:septal ring factor EnvC (AmiA/AmiB activator)